MVSSAYRPRKPKASPLWQCLFRHFDAFLGPYEERYQRMVLQLPDGIPGAVMAIHTFGEYLGFHPHLHAIVADGLFVRGGWFHVLPEAVSRPLEELFRARTIAFLLNEGLLPPERARMLRRWKHSGFNVHRSQRIQPHQREDLERLAQ